MKTFKDIEIEFHKTLQEFILLPELNTDICFNYMAERWERWITIGWLFWYVRFYKPIKIKEK